MPQTLFAHPEPGFGIVNAEDQGKLYIEKLVNEKVLSQDWASAFADLDQSGSQVIKGKKRWVMVYENSVGGVIKVTMTPLGKFVTYEIIRKQ